MTTAPQIQLVAATPAQEPQASPPVRRAEPTTLPDSLVFAHGLPCGTEPSAAPLGHAELDEVLRMAAIGGLTSSLVHDVASYIQGLVGYLDELHYMCEGEPGAGVEVSELIDGALDRAGQMMRLFRAMRGLIRSGEVARRPARIADLVERALQLCGSYVRSRTRLEVSELPADRVLVCESLFVQVLTSVLCNAADHVAPNTPVKLTVVVSDGAVRIEVQSSRSEQQPGRIEFGAPAGDGGFSSLWSSTAARVMEEHGGAIGSRENGTVTEIELPLPSHEGLPCAR